MISFWSLLPIYTVFFLLAVILPAVTVTFLVRTFTEPPKVRFSSLFPFIIALTISAVIANVLWETFIFNHIYYEWDRFILPYTFLGHEAPVIDFTSSWLADGWTHIGLRFLWLIISLVVYTVSGIAGIYYCRHEKLLIKLREIVVHSVIVLSLISLLIFLVWLPFS